MMSPKMVSKFHLSFGFFMRKELRGAVSGGKSAFSRRSRLRHVIHQARRNLSALQRASDDEFDSLPLLLAGEVQLHQFSISENLSDLVVQLMQRIPRLLKVEIHGCASLVKRATIT